VLADIVRATLSRPSGRWTTWSEDVLGAGAGAGT
jgi:hypothetical protein